MLLCLCLVPGRVRVAVRLRPRNAEELAADADFADCVELQPEVSSLSFFLLYNLYMHSISFYFTDGFLCCFIVCLLHSA